VSFLIHYIVTSRRSEHNNILLGNVFGTEMIRQVASIEPLASSEPSLLKAKVVTGSWCVLGTVIKTCSDLLLQIRIPISEEANAINFPSALKDKSIGLL